MKNRLLIATVNFLIQADRGQLSDVKNYTPEITYNNTRTYKNGKKAPDGIEIRFGKVRPSEAVRKVFKENGFRYSERQNMWYGFDNEESREFINTYVGKGVEIDATQYEKQYFWAKVRSKKEFDKLYSRTEFQIRSEPARYYNSKYQIEKSEGNLYGLIIQGFLYFKKFYNRVVQEGESDAESDSDSEDEESNINHLEISNRLKALADNMTEVIRKKLNPPIGNQRPTARRSRIASGIREEGYRLQKIQTVLYGLSQAHKDKVIIDEYYLLSKIRTKKQVELLLTADSFDNNSNFNLDFFRRHYDEFSWIGILMFDDWQKAIKQKNKLIEVYSQDFVAERTEVELKIKKLEGELLSRNIPGFFPTPPDLIQRMIELAELKVTHSILEPSAGKGDIIDAVKQKYSGQNVNISAIEVNSSLREILKLKGYTIVGNDFLSIENLGQKFDRVLMNPPFENTQDIDHVVHALKFLKPSGRLVAIMGEGAFFRKYKKETAFRLMLKEKNAFVSEPIREAFRNAFNSTGVNVRIVVINGGVEEVISNEEIRLLELEADAELELVKLRIELAKKKKNLNGLEGLSFELDNNEDWNVLNFN